MNEDIMKTLLDKMFPSQIDAIEPMVRRECEMYWEEKRKVASLVDALEAIRSGRVAMKLWVNKYTKCGEESYAHRLSDSALRTFIVEQALALVEGKNNER